METAPRLIWRTVITWVIVLLAGITSWQLTMIFFRLDLSLRWWSLGLALGVIHTLLAFSLLEGGLTLPVAQKWAYRQAFLISAGWGIFLWFRHPFGWVLCLTILLGAFFGALIGTRQHLGFWEDNHPPPKEIREAVYQRHREILGTPPPNPRPKRVFDILLASIGLALSFPVWIICLFLIWFEDPGPLFFVKNSVGKGGRNFHQFKLRTMVRGAEVVTGPVLAAEEDSRALRFGRFLRKTALDELPQLVNILRSDMSFVGPRPQRTVLVYEYLQEMPEFAERHLVLPGLAGLAQVAGHYYITPRQKLRYDRIYARHASLGFDLKLIILAVLLVFFLRWKPGGADRIPRHWLH
jgi:lipopolysaccharide/colanic/teichoic acid biosynthesis glycosyltransferase